jgi:hypothetical protein
MRARTKIALVVILIVLPIALRWVWFHRGWYLTPAIPQIDESQIAVPLSEYTSAAAIPAETSGRAVIDMGHLNNLQVDDLNPLQDRLIERGLAIETYDGYSVYLSDQLRGATALLVAAPTIEFTAEERTAVQDFVEDGGRVLLVADPTRPIPPATEEDSLDLAEILLPESATPAINSVASAVGVVYFDDYLYNLVDNEGNYRNVKLTVLSEDQLLTQGVEDLIFFATHSLRSDGPALIGGDENTYSSLRTGETNLAAAVLSANERVLALGDLTVLTAPYHDVADNDRFLSNIADWLSAAERTWDVREFPYLFQGPVDMVQLGGDFLDPRLIAQSGPLQEVFHEAGLEFNVRATADAEHDALFVGTFENAEPVQEYLDAAGITITIAEGEKAASAEEPKSTVEVEGLGTITIEDTTLFVVDRGAGRVVLIALAQDGDSAIQALDRLAYADFIGCVQRDDVTVCSTGEAAEGLGLDLGGEGAGRPPGATPTAARPRIGSRLESAAALDAEAPTLEELAEESYDVTSQAGETYTYTVSMERSQDVLWTYGWCTATEEQLKQNWENISLVFTLEDEEVPLERFVLLEGLLDEQQCRLYYVLVTDWPRGEYVLTTEVTFASELDDGFDVYPAGTHTYRYEVSVAR